MNNLENYKSYIGNNLKEVSVSDTNVVLIEKFGHDIEVIYTIVKDEVNVVELNHACAHKQQANETVKNMEEAIKVSSQWF